MTRIKALALSICLIFFLSSTAQAAVLGPAYTFAQLCELAEQAQDGDTILVSGEICAEGEIPLTTQVSLRITAADESSASLKGISLSNAAVTFTNVSIEDSISISGTSHVELGSGVSVSGSAGKSAVSFSGNGSLLMYPDCTVTGGEGGEGVTIRHTGGDFYAGIEGTITGGSGSTGGSGLTVSNLKDTGMLMVSGSITGGSGHSMGGHAMNLYELSDNAFVTVAGSVQGGSGTVGGDGIQLVAASGNVSVGIQGQIQGGNGKDYGGDGLILMNMSGASSVSLEGSLSGGNVTSDGTKPGTSLMVVGSSAAARTRVGDCNLQDGRKVSATPTPSPISTPGITPLPEITSSVDDSDALNTPAPEVAPDSENSAEPIATPEPETSAEPDNTEDPAEEDIPEETAAPDASAAPEMTEAPTPEATMEETPAPSESPSPSPTPSATPTAEPTPEA